MGVIILIGLLLLVALVVGIFIGYGMALRRTVTAAEKMESQRNMGRVFIGGGAACLVVSLCAAVYSCYFIATAQSANGTITEMRERKDKEGGSTYSPTFVFRDAAGAEHRIDETLYSAPPRYRVGDTVRILYQPKKPENAHIDGFWYEWFIPFVTGLLGMIFLPLGFVLLHGSRITERLRVSLSHSRSGRFIRAALRF